MSDNRKQSRLGIQLDVDLVAEEQKCSLQTRDLSNSGVFLEKGESNLPAVGSIVHIRVNANLGEGEPPLVKARVVRVDDDGIALAFITDE